MAAARDSLCAGACAGAGVDARFLKLRFQGIELDPVAEPPLVISEGNPSATGLRWPLPRSTAPRLWGKFIGTPGGASLRTSGRVRPVDCEDRQNPRG